MINPTLLQCLYIYVLKLMLSENMTRTLMESAKLLRATEGRTKYPYILFFVIWVFDIISFRNKCQYEKPSNANDAGS
jgi:hypothetical protein